MKKLLSLFTVIIFAAVCSAAVSACGKKTDPTIYGEQLNASPYISWVGRYEYSDRDKCVYTYYAATGLTVKFYGTELSVSYKATNTSSAENRPYFAVSVDGESIREGKQFCLTESRQRIKVADNLPEGEHTVTVLKRSEPENSLTAVTEISTDGKFLPLEQSAALKFQILGGSGITGHGCLGSATEGWTTENSSPFESFGYLAAERFGAETQFVSASGMGLLWGYRGVAPLTTAYDSAGLVATYNGDGSTAAVNTVEKGWNHSAWKPDVIIANIGGNDWNSHISLLSGNERSAAETQFKNAVSALLNKIFTLYPDTRVVWAVNSLSGGNGKLAADAINSLSQKDRIFCVEIDNSKNGADNHASAKDHSVNASRIIEVIETFDLRTLG